MLCDILVSKVVNPVAEFRILSVTSKVTGKTLSLRDEHWNKIPKLISLLSLAYNTFSEKDVEIPKEATDELFLAVHEGWTGTQSTVNITSVANPTTQVGDKGIFTTNPNFSIGDKYSKVGEIHTRQLSADHMQAVSIGVNSVSIDGTFSIHQNVPSQFYSYSYDPVTGATTNSSNERNRPIEGNPTEWIEVTYNGIKKRIPAW
jgi:hypothetical protein